MPKYAKPSDVFLDLDFNNCYYFADEWGDCCGEKTARQCCLVGAILLCHDNERAAIPDIRKLALAIGYNGFRPYSIKTVPNGVELLTIDPEGHVLVHSSHNIRTKEQARDLFLKAGM